MLLRTADPYNHPQRMKPLSSQTLPLSDNGSIPVLGLGVWQTPKGDVTRNAVSAALRIGYRHIDTARIYGNEEDVGIAVRESGVARNEIFVTTKLWNKDHGYDPARKAFDASLKRLGLESVDLYLIHWPVQSKRIETWSALEAIKREGRAKHIGVSNYLVPHLEELRANCNELPSVNQIEVHPFLQHRETRDWCARHNIVVEAYSPLGNGRKLFDPTVNSIAERIGRTPAQVLIRWSVQNNLVVLPKSANPDRIEQNGNVFDFALDASAMNALNALEAGDATGWDPRTQD